MLEFNKICKYRTGQLAYLLEKMKNTMVDDKNLLDSSMVIWGSPMADSNLHNHRRCPLVFFGNANGQLQGGLHLKAPDGTPMANAMLTAHAQARHGRREVVRRQHGRIRADDVRQEDMKRKEREEALHDVLDFVTSRD